MLQRVHRLCVGAFRRNWRGLGNGVFASPTQRHRGGPMKTDALKVVILLLILALCFLLFLGVRAQAQETNDQVVLVFDRIENGKIILTPKVGVDTLTVHGIGLLQDSKDVKRAQREEKDEKAPSPKFNKKTKTYSCPPTWGVSSEDEVRCRKAR